MATLIAYAEAKGCRFNTFCAGFTVAMLDGLNLHDTAVFANAVGALAVTRKGPIEGAPTRQQVTELIAAQVRSPAQ